MNINVQPDIKIRRRKPYFSGPKDFIVLFIGILSIVYLLNFSFGFLEFLPDNVPLVGNIDEFLATGILVSVLRYFGIDVTKFFKR